MSNPRHAHRNQVLLAFAVGVLLRVAFTVVEKGQSIPTVDGPWYAEVARMLNEGNGMVFPAVHDRWGAEFHTAQHPPLFAMYVAGALQVVGRNALALRLVSGLLGALGILVAAGLGKEVGGRRLSLVLAWLVALSPLVWINDAEVHSESAHIPIVLGVLWAAYRLERLRSVGSAAVLGVLIGLATLNRSEAAILCVLLALPLVADMAQEAWRRRVQLLAVCAAAVMVMVLPWVGYNLTRFEARVWLSTSAGGVLPMANCEETYYGDVIGYTTVGCWFDRAELPLGPPTGADVNSLGGLDIDPASCRCDPDDWSCIEQLCLIGDEGAYGSYGSTKGLHYMHEHLDRVPYVVALRVLRSLELYDPLQKAAWDVEVDRRSRVVGWLGLGWYYLTIPFAVHGLVLLRRRNRTLLPISALFISSLLAAAIASSVTRFRLGFDVAVLLPVGVSLVALWDRRDAVRARPAEAELVDQSSS